jgi:hypothetical protein
MGCSNGIHAPVYSAISRGITDFTGQTFQMPGDAKAWWSKHQKDCADDMTAKKK